YISGRFSTGYRPTIGADFITETIQSEERFSSLSRAFFRGADALCQCHVHALQAQKWWYNFCAHTLARGEHRAKFCVMVVGNKVDV
ncbi:hypothetical protein BJ165DRAFT_1319446, partial [Panaeolus papilionaceus]